MGGHLALLIPDGAAPVSHDAVRRVLERSRDLGFLGPGAVDQHIDHALGFARALGAAAPPRRVFDLGAGGGLPGLVLFALAFPEATGVLLDSMVRRTAFLRQAVDELGLSGRVLVWTERAEDAGRREGARGAFDLVTARSFGPPAVTAECAAPFLDEGGVVVVSEPPAGTPRWSADGLTALGLGLRGEVEVPEHFAVLERRSPCPDRYPRRVGSPAKRPLF